MTKHQKTAIDRILAYVTQNDCHGDTEKYEVKTFDIDTSHFETSGLVFVYSVAGLKNDEGTMAAVLCRNKRFITIGKNGGVRGYTNRYGKCRRLQGWKNVMIYGFEH